MRVQFVESFRKGSIAFQDVELAAVIKDRRGEDRPQIIADLLAGEFSGGLLKLLAKDFIGLIAASESDDTYRRRKRSIGCEIVERRNELAMGQVTGCPEDHHGAGIWHGAAG